MSKYKRPMETEKKYVWGQYFTRKEIVKKVLDLLKEYKTYSAGIKILEPSAGTGNFVACLKDMGFDNIETCEIDKELTKNPRDFFEYPLKKKFDFIVGNPPFTKYNVKNSYYYPEKYLKTSVSPRDYLTKDLIKKTKIQIENAFILKSIKHLKDRDSSIGFVLPISFFIKNKNKEVKKEIVRIFSTIIVYQNDRTWFDEPIPCCFAIFTNIERLKDKMVLLYEDGGNVEEILDKSKLITEEAIPKSYLYKKNNHQDGVMLSAFLSDEKIMYKKSYTANNVSAGNILEKNCIPGNKNASEYCLAVARVGNSSVGKAGLINLKEDVLNDMFYVFGFNEPFRKDREIKENICRLINQGREHFKNCTIRVGSKSIKRSDVFDFRVKIEEY